MAQLTVDMAAGDALLIAPGGQAKVELIHKSGRRVRLRISADRDVVVRRDAGELASDPASQPLDASDVPRLAK